ncbi:MAG: ribosome silencing factor [Schaalia hyovaginalis]|nr:ribosome silencing factor [Schaalia hyovaginalis]MDD7553453.1 ribosome silencing factor [Schaalia hyovaginalis]
MPVLTSDLVEVAAKAAFDKLALNPVLVNVADRLAIAESFLIASASSERQVRAIGEEILDRVADELGVEPDHIEGRTGNRWILLDYGELVVHVLLDEERDFYRLENLWSDGVIVPLEDPALSDPVRERLGA